MDVTLQQLAEHVSADLKGDALCVIKGLSSLEKAGTGDITFLSSSRFRRFLPSTSASAVILTASDGDEWPTNARVVKEPDGAYAKSAQGRTSSTDAPSGIHPTAVVADDAKISASAYISANAVVESGAIIGDKVHIGPGCFVGKNASIGEHSKLIANVAIYHEVIVGKRVLIHAGTVIGSDGFGFANEGGRWVKVPQVGRVIVGDDVDIGANTAIDRGALEDTIIANGVIIDNLVHIAHNVEVGENTAIAGCVGIAGSTKIGKNCAFGGISGVAGHIEIGDNCQFTGMAMVTHSIKEPGVYSSGIPAQENRVWRKNVVRFRQMDKLEKRVKELEAKLAQLTEEK